MKSFKEKIYWHREKSENWNTEDKAKQLGFNTESIRWIGNEVEFEIEIFEDGTNKIVSIKGIDVSDKNISI